LALGGRLCLSDDSHGVDQVSLNFHRVLEFLDRLGVDKLHYLSLVGEEGGDLSAAPDKRFPRTRVAAVSMEEVKQMAFWKV
jgi:histidinol-phosphatase (PHP family)